MRMKVIGGILGLCTLSQGCGPLTLATRTLAIEPIHYCRTADNILELHRDCKLAEAAWKKIENADLGHAHTPDFAKGFQDGFVDYLYAGGSGEPPPLPPRYYWKMRYETPQGREAIEDWFAGFRLGAAVARESGYRQWVSIPSSLPRMDAGLPPSATMPQSTAVPSSEPVLAPPRKILPPQDPVNNNQDGGRPANASPPSTADKHHGENSYTIPAERVGPQQ